MQYDCSCLISSRWFVSYSLSPLSEGPLASTKRMWTLSDHWLVVGSFFVFWTEASRVKTWLWWTGLVGQLPAFNFACSCPCAQGVTHGVDDERTTLVRSDHDGLMLLNVDCGCCCSSSWFLSTARWRKVIHQEARPVGWASRVKKLMMVPHGAVVSWSAFNFACSAGCRCSGEWRTCFKNDNDWKQAAAVIFTIMYTYHQPSSQSLSSSSSAHTPGRSKQG